MESRVEGLDPAAAAIFRRPHYHIRDGALIFLASARPLATLSRDELLSWETLAAETSPDAIRACVGPGADRALARLCELGVCDAVGSFPSGRRKVVVIEPHSDDAALSIGATMWLQRNEIEFTLVTVASRSNFTSYFLSQRDFFRVDEVTHIRNEEGAAFMRQLGGRHVALGENEATLRYRDDDWSLDYLRSHQISVSSFSNRHALAGDLERWRKVLRPVLAGLDGAELWMPLGVGNHSDHELARNACLLLLIAEPELARGSEIRLYQDVPYDTKHTAHLGRILQELRSHGAVLVHEAVRVEPAYARKLELLSVYASQFKVPAIAGEVDESSHAGGSPGERREHLYRLERRPNALSVVRMTLDEPYIERAVPQVRRWIERHHRARKIRILTVVPSGRWREDAHLLGKVFPATCFELYVPPAGAAEADSAASPRVVVRHVTGGPNGWVRTTLRLALARPAPTLFICGEREGPARLLAQLWPLSDTIITPTMDHFMLALAAVTGVAASG